MSKSFSQARCPTPVYLPDEWLLRMINILFYEALEPRA